LEDALEFQDIRTVYGGWARARKWRGLEDVSIGRRDSDVIVAMKPSARLAVPPLLDVPPRELTPGEKRLLSSYREMDTGTREYIEAITWRTVAKSLLRQPAKLHLVNGGAA
jgi:hypothetical protein